MLALCRRCGRPRRKRGGIALFNEKRFQERAKEVEAEDAALEAEPESAAV